MHNCIEELVPKGFLCSRLFLRQPALQQTPIAGFLLFVANSNYYIIIGCDFNNHAMNKLHFQKQFLIFPGKL